MQKLKLSDMIIKKQSRFIPKDVESIKSVAYDTETQNGLCTLIADSYGRHMHPYSFDDCIDFLCRGETRGAIGWWYNLKYDFQAILKWLPPELWKKIYNEGKLKIGDMEVFYIPKKLLVVKKHYKSSITKLGKTNNKKSVKTWKFYDLAQYFRMKLDNAGLKYCNEKKNYHPYNLKHIPDWLIKDKLFIDYCIQDAKLTLKLSHWWIKLCQDNDLKTKNFCSAASISASYFTKRVKFPTINQFLKSKKLKKYLEYGWNSVSGAFISCYKKGMFDNISVIDINSAYPNEMSNFPNLHKGEFIFSKMGIPAGAFLGWMKVKINIDNKFSYHPPFPILRKNLPNYYPIGNLDTYITYKEYLFFKDIYDIRIIDGLYWIPDKLEFPFKKVINHIYKTRKATKDANVNFFLKIILNGIYGKFLEKYDVLDPDHENFGFKETGNLFNPFVASYILAGTRIKVFEKMLEIDDKNIIACFTDSILTKKMPDNFKDSSILGDWGLETQGSALILGCGVYTIKGKTIKNKLRGFKTDSKAENNLFELCKTFYNQDKIKLNIIENVSPLTSIIQHKTNDMNLLIEKLKLININFDTKRFWSYYPKTAGEYLEREIDSLAINNFNLF